MHLALHAWNVNFVCRGIRLIFYRHFDVEVITIHWLVSNSGLWEYQLCIFRRWGHRPIQRLWDWRPLGKLPYYHGEGTSAGKSGEINSNMPPAYLFQWTMLRCWDCGRNTFILPSTRASFSRRRGLCFYLSEHSAAHSVWIKFWQIISMLCTAKARQFIWIRLSWSLLMAGVSAD